MTSAANLVSSDPGAAAPAAARSEMHIAAIDAYFNSAQAGEEYSANIQFDFLFAYARGHQSPCDMVASEVAAERTALWLTSFLAHWGMFRGSSNLKNKNIQFFAYLVKQLLNKKNGILVPLLGVGFGELNELDKNVLDTALKACSKVLADQSVTATGTLVSKILLGLTQTTPAYDQYFRDGLGIMTAAGQYQGSKQFGASSLLSLSKWYRKHQWPVLACAVDPALALPDARIIDIAIYQLGQPGKRVSQAYTESDNP